MRSSIFFTFFLLIITPNVNAALNGLSHHSRANCVNNESISWDATQRHNMATASEHFPWISFSGFINSPAHFIESGAQFDRIRVASIHKYEGLPVGLPQYAVRGHHWLNINRYRTVYRQTTAIDCNLKDGFVNWGATY